MRRNRKQPFYVSGREPLGPARSHMALKKARGGRVCRLTGGKSGSVELIRQASTSPPARESSPPVRKMSAFLRKRSASRCLSVSVIRSMRCRSLGFLVIRRGSPDMEARNSPACSWRTDDASSISTSRRSSRAILISISFRRASWSRPPAADFDLRSVSAFRNAACPRMTSANSHLPRLTGLNHPSVESCCNHRGVHSRRAAASLVLMTCFVRSTAGARFLVFFAAGFAAKSVLRSGKYCSYIRCEVENHFSKKRAKTALPRPRVLHHQPKGTLVGGGV